MSRRRPSRALILSVALMAASLAVLGAAAPRVEGGGRIRANSWVSIRVPRPAADPPVIVDIVDPWGQVVWTGASRGPDAVFYVRDWADGPYLARFSTGGECPFFVATEFFGGVRARAGLILREIDGRRDGFGMPPEELRGASDLLQRVVTEHVYSKPEEVVSGNLYHGELALGFRTRAATVRILGSGAADYMDGYDEPYRPGCRESTMMFVPPNAVVDFAQYGARKLARWGYGIGDIEHVFISHCHGDHFHPQAIAAFALKRVEAGLPPLTVHAGEASIRLLEAHIAEHDLHGKITLQRLEAGVTARTGELEVTPVSATHAPDSTPFCYIFEWRETTTYYGTDTGYPCRETLETLAARRFDVFVHELTVPSAEDGIVHMDVGDLRRLIGKLRAAGAIDAWTRVVTFHQGRALDEALRDALHFQQMIGYEAGYDGMPIPLAYRDEGTPLRSGHEGLALDEAE